MNEHVSELMTPDPIAVNVDASYKQLDELLAGSLISAVPVIDGHGKPIGVVSEADLLARLRHRTGETRPGLFSSAASRQDWDKSRGLIAADLMTTPVQTISSCAPVTLAAVRMAESGVRRSG
ncbi:CBS domain-containing protein [Amycolatopsis sp. H20-H5]|uniref:CBS domain-containing protein n=1 Tax=Amycolatopsis sp. H20-H5 TaxID=3046309 RepID=UPI002DB7E85F|nr:CBS domain-containing protein [Amycolatopsis sp. H20-H5]MEC3982234.1 CBS domain-containing protein [Amycolatopsis sp. H20-H5]